MIRVRTFHSRCDDNNSNNTLQQQQHSNNSLPLYSYEFQQALSIELSNLCEALLLRAHRRASFGGGIDIFAFFIARDWSTSRFLRFFLCCDWSKSRFSRPHHYEIASTGTFLVGGPGKKRKKRERKISQVFRRFFRFGLRGCSIFRVLVFGHVPSAARPPRALQFEPRHESRLIRTILCRAIEGVETNSMRGSMKDICIIWQNFFLKKTSFAVWMTHQVSGGGWWVVPATPDAE